MELPTIVPARPVEGKAEAIDRAGAAIQEGANVASAAGFEWAKTQLVLQSQEAAAKVGDQFTALRDFVRDNPHLRPEKVKELFGGEVPPEVKLEENFAQPDGSVGTRTRDMVAMHEVAPFLFDRYKKTIIENSARKIESKMFSTKFRLAAEQDADRYGNEIGAWMSAQRMAEAEVRSLAAMQAFENARNWDGYEAVLNNPDNHISLEVREKMKAAYPELRTKTTAIDAIGAASEEELPGVREELMKPDSVLSTESRLSLLNYAGARESSLREARERAEKAAYQAKMNFINDEVFDAAMLARGSGGKATLRDLWDPANPDNAEKLMGLDATDQKALLAFIDAESKHSTIETKWDVYTWAAKQDKSGAIASWGENQVMALRPVLADSEFEQVVGWWRAAKGQAAGAKNPLDDQDITNIRHFLRDRLGMTDDPKALDSKRDRFRQAEGRMIKRMIEFKRKNPDAILTYEEIRDQGLIEWRASSGKEEDVVSAVTTGLRSAGMKVDDLTIAEHVAKAKGREDLVGDAVDVFIDPELEVNEEFVTGAVHAILINPAERAKVEAQVREAGLDPAKEKNLVFQIVKNIAPAQARPYQAKVEQNAVSEAVREAANAAGAEVRQNIADAQAGFDKAARERKAAREALPGWEQDALRLEEERASQAAEDVYNHVLGRLEAEDRAAQQRRAGPGKPILGDRFADDPVRKAMEARARAEADTLAGGAVMKARVEVQEALESYRLRRKEFDRGTPEIVKEWNKAGVTSFRTYFQLRQEGKVR